MLCWQGKNQKKKIIKQIYQFSNLCSWLQCKEWKSLLLPWHHAPPSEQCKCSSWQYSLIKRKRSILFIRGVKQYKSQNKIFSKYSIFFMMGKWDYKSSSPKKTVIYWTKFEILIIILPLFIEERKVQIGKENKPGPFKNLPFLRLFTSYSYWMFTRCPADRQLFIYYQWKKKEAKQIGPRPPNKCQRPNSVKICVNPHLFSFYLLYTVEKMRKDSKIDGMFVTKHFG